MSNERRAYVAAMVKQLFACLAYAGAIYLALAAFSLAFADSGYSRNKAVNGQIVYYPYPLSAGQQCVNDWCMGEYSNSTGASAGAASGSDFSANNCHDSSGNAIVYGPSCQGFTCPSGQWLQSNGTCAVQNCSGGQIWNGQSCSCPSGQQLINGTCQQPCASKTGAVSSPGYIDMGTDPNATMGHQSCNGSNSCSVYFYGSAQPSARSLVNGVYHYYTIGYYSYSDSTGAAASASCSGTTMSIMPNTSSSIPANTCGSGQTLGTFNGQPMCLDSSSNPVNPNQTTQSTNTTDTTTTNADGTKTVTQTTTNADGSKTVTTTNYDTQNNVVNQTTQTTGQDPLNNFCSDNPSSPLCTAKNITDCDKHPDAIGCQLEGTPDATGPASAGTFDMGTLTAPVYVGMTDGSCPAPVSVGTPYGVISFDYSWACQYASDIRPVVLLMGAFMAVLIFVGGLKT